MRRRRGALIKKPKFSRRQSGVVLRLPRLLTMLVMLLLLLRIDKVRPNETGMTYARDWCPRSSSTRAAAR